MYVENDSNKTMMMMMMMCTRFSLFSDFPPYLKDNLICMLCHKTMTENSFHSAELQQPVMTENENNSGPESTP